MALLAPVALRILRPVSAGVVAWRSQGTTFATVIVKATFGVVAGAAARLVAPTPLVLADKLSGSRSMSSLDEASDLAPYLPQAGFTVKATAHAINGSKAASLTAAIGVHRERPLLEKHLYVVGDRVGGGRPAPFSSMPIVYERAYGGPHVLENPVGVGASGDRAPNIVAPDDAQRPTGFAPVSRAWSPRARLARDGEAHPAGPDTTPMEVAADVDFRVFCAAPADQTLPYFRGDEWLTFDGMHVALARLSTRLPSVTASARWWVEGRRAAPLDLVADTLHVDLDRGVGSLVWRGRVALERPEALASMHVDAAVEMPGFAAPWLEDKPAEITDGGAHVSDEAAASKRAPPVQIKRLDEAAGRSATVDAMTMDDADVELDVDQPAGRSATVDQPAGRSATSDQPAGRSATSDQPAGRSATSDQPAGRSATVDQPAGRSATVDQPAGRSATVDQPAGRSATVDAGSIEEEGTSIMLVPNALARPLPFKAPSGPSPMAPATGPSPRDPDANMNATAAEFISPFARELPFPRAAATAPAPTASRAATPFAAPMPAATADDSDPLNPELKTTSTEAISPFAKPVTPFLPSQPSAGPARPAAPIPGAPWSAAQGARPPAPHDDEAGTMILDGAELAAQAARAASVAPVTPERAAWPSVAEVASPFAAPPDRKWPTVGEVPSPFAGPALPTAQAPPPPPVQPPNVAPPPAVAMGQDPRMPARVDGVEEMDAGDVSASAEVRAALLERVRTKRGVEGLALAGANLSKLDLRGANLAGANLARTALIGANLDGASLVGASLVGAELGGASLVGADLERADFTRATLKRAILDGAALSGANFSDAVGGGASFAGAKGARAIFSRGTWDGAVLRDVDLLGADFVAASLAGADLSGAKLEAARLDDARAPGARFTGARAPQLRASGANFDDAHLDQLDAPESLWERASLVGASARAAILRGATFARANLTSCVLATADLEGASLQRAIAASADLSGAKLDGADLRQLRAAGARFDGAQLHRATASKADLSGAHFIDAALDGATLREATLKGASLLRAQLDGADLRDADLEETDLRGASMKGAKVAGARKSNALEGDAPHRA